MLFPNLVESSFYESSNELSIALTELLDSSYRENIATKTLNSYKYREHSRKEVSKLYNKIDQLLFAGGAW